MGLTFDSPVSVSVSSTAYDTSHRRESTAYASLTSKSKKSLGSLEKLKRKARKAFGGSGSSPSSLAVNTAKFISPTPAKQSHLFRLPLAVRQKIYGFIVGQDELLHIMLRYRAAPTRWKVAYRRCAAGGNVENCVLKNCREYYNVSNGSYYGYFDNVGGLFQVCRDIYSESSQVLYQQNTLEFDHPMSLPIFSGEVSPSSLQSIRSISIDMHRYIYAHNVNNSSSLSTNLHREQWLQTWNIISTMQGLEEVKVRFQLLIDGWMGWTEKEILEPLFNVRQALKIFEVELPLSSAKKKTIINCDEERKDVPFILVRY